MLKGQWRSTSLKVVAVIAFWAFRAVMSSSDLRKITLTRLARLLKTSSCWAENAFTNLVDSIKLRIGHHSIAIKHWKKQIKRFKELETGSDAVDVEEAKTDQIETQGCWLRQRVTWSVARSGQEQT